MKFATLWLRQENERLEAENKKLKELIIKQAKEINKLREKDLYEDVSS